MLQEISMAQLRFRQYHYTCAALDRMQRHEFKIFRYHVQTGSDVSHITPFRKYRVFSGREKERGMHLRLQNMRHFCNS
jgi:hypothetical protein